MSGAPAVTFDAVWKKFQKGERHDSLRDLLPTAVGRLFRPRPAGELADQEFWALTDVSFKVARGEGFGIIGRNGAGKSTALKLLTRILRPTRGSCSVKGRVGALIEVSSGFHPDLTGRENVYLQAAIMGMSRAQTAQRFDAIIEFSGVGEFIDTPLKRYSSGMNARLGFAVAAHLEPEVLIIDEVLSVGDSMFQARCIDRIRRLKDGGVALVFVSHNLPAVESLCDRVLWLDHGKEQFQGEPRRAVAAYLSSSTTAVADRDATGLTPNRRNGEIDFVQAELLDDTMNPTSAIVSGAHVVLRHSLVCNEGPRTAIVGFGIHSADKHIVFGENNTVDSAPLNLESGERAEVTVHFSSLSLPEGRYYFKLSVEDPLTGKVYDQLDPAVHFDVVVPQERNRTGSVCLSTTWQVTRSVARGSEYQGR